MCDSWAVVVSAVGVVCLLVHGGVVKSLSPFGQHRSTPKDARLVKIRSSFLTSAKFSQVGVKLCKVPTATNESHTRQLRNRNHQSEKALQIVDL
jgi:hypothetical protein